MRAAPPSDPRPRTVAVHHRSGIGDLAWHVPYLRALAAQSAGGRLTLVAKPSCRAHEVLAGEDCIEAILEFDRQARDAQGRRQPWRRQWALLGALRAGRFDRIHIFSGRVRYAALAWLAGIPARHGFGFGLAERLLLNRPPYIRPYRGPGNWVLPELGAYAVAQGLVEAPCVPRLSPHPAALQEAEVRVAGLPGRRHAFGIGASNPVRHWGDAAYGALAQRLIEAGDSVVLVGGPAEAGRAAAIVDAVPPAQRAALLVSCASSVQTSIGLLAACDDCIGNDSGVLNLAAALGKPSLGLFGVSPPLTHDPLLQAVEGQGMEGIPVEAVWHRLEGLGLLG